MNLKNCFTGGTVALVLLWQLSGCAAPEQKKNITGVPGTRIEILDAEALQLLDSTSPIEKIAEGFTWAEGPVYIPQGDYLLFSDVPNNKVYKWKEGEGATLFLDSSGYVGNQVPEREPGSNGLLLDAEGRLVLCQHGLRRVARMDAPLTNPRPVYIPLAESFDNKKLNSPNDAIFHSNGDLYFTDPPYGHAKLGEDPALEQKHHGIYLRRTDGTVELFDSEINFPNGVALTPDEKSLIVGYSNPENMIWMKFELDTKGLAKSKSVFYKVTEEERVLPGSVDGLTINSKGYVLASAPGGIFVFSPAGKLLARILTGQATSNCTLSDDEKTLYMTCHQFVYRLALK